MKHSLIACASNSAIWSPLASVLPTHSLWGHPVYAMKLGSHWQQNGYAHCTVNSSINRKYAKLPQFCTI
jgi:hypothetical protein